MARPHEHKDEIVLGIPTEIEKIGKLIGSFLVPALERGHLLVVHVYPNAAADGRLRKGDKITHIGEYHTSRMTRSHVQHICIRGLAHLQVVSSFCAFECNHNWHLTHFIDY
jgi:hypothetical protein